MVAERKNMTQQLPKKFQLVKMAPKSPDKDAETIVFIKEMAKLLPPSLKKFKIPLLCFMDLSITLGFSSKSGSEDRYLPNPRGSLGNGIWQLHSYWKLQSLELSFCKMCCWPTLVSLWTTFESWPEFWRMMVFHQRKKKKKITNANLYYITELIYF